MQFFWTGRTLGMARELVKPHWNKLVYAHRLTHIDNIPDILNVGFVHPSSEKANPNYVSIGDIERRL